MGFSAIQIILVFVWTFIIAIDQFDFLESLYQPIVSGAVIGAILGDLPTGLVVGGTYQLMTIGNMPVGGAQPPNAVSAALWLLSSLLAPAWTSMQQWPGSSLRSYRPVHSHSAVHRYVPHDVCR